MERLTKRDADGQAVMDCQKCKADWTGKHECNFESGVYSEPKFIVEKWNRRVDNG